MKEGSEYVHVLKTNKNKKRELKLGNFMNPKAKTIMLKLSPSKLFAPIKPHGGFALVQSASLN